MSMPVELQLVVQHEGRTWNLYTFDFNTPDGTFSSYFYAVSDEHAAELLMDMKETATLSGKMVKVTKI